MFTQSIGNFICVHNQNLKMDDRIDEIRASSVDVRQDAAVRMLQYLTHEEVPFETDEEFIEQIDEHGIMARTSLSHAHHDALRKKNGYVYISEDGVNVGTKPLHPTDRGYRDFKTAKQVDTDGLMADEGEFEVIENWYSSNLQILFNEGTKVQQESIEYMLMLADMKERGEPTNSEKIRSKLKRLRRETGWTLKVNLL